jgi:hypothetical protein
MIHKNASQLRADGSLRESGCYRRVNTAGQGTYGLARSNLLSNLSHTLLDKGLGRPFSLKAANVEQEIVDDVCPMRGVGHFGMELQPIELALLVSHSSQRRIGRVGQCLERWGQFLDPIAMAHPDRLREWEAGK